MLCLNYCKSVLCVGASNTIFFLYLITMYEQIDQYIAKTFQMTQEDLDFFHSILRHKKFKKKEFLLRAGEVCCYETFILKGCTRAYFMDERGAEVVLQFAVENWWVGDMASFNYLMPSNMYVEALEDTEVFQIHHDDKEELYRRIPQFERLFRLLVQRAYTVLLNRFSSMVSKSAEERYLDFIHNYPQIPQRVSQVHIASFLGVSPEFLSKIRTRLAKSH